MRYLFMIAGAMGLALDGVLRRHNGTGCARREECQLF